MVRKYWNNLRLYSIIMLLITNENMYSNIIREKEPIVLLIMFDTNILIVISIINIGILIIILINI